MTPRDARKAGASWALSRLAARAYGTAQTRAVYRERFFAERERIPHGPLRDAFDGGYIAELRRLGETGHANG